MPAAPALERSPDDVTPGCPRPAAPAARPPGPSWPRWLGGTLAAAGVIEVPWLFVLARTLPATASAAHWRAAWVGLDALEAAALIATGLLLARRDSRCGLAAAAAAALLVSDAWFDVTTAAPGRPLATALAMAACPELPLAAMCAGLTIRGHLASVPAPAPVGAASPPAGSASR
jgi:hypothetical protein